MRAGTGDTALAFLCFSFEEHRERPVNRRGFRLRRERRQTRSNDHGLAVCPEQGDALLRDGNAPQGVSGWLWASGGVLGRGI
jgi:hypothetical protein